MDLLKDCNLELLSKPPEVESFDCGNADLNEFLFEEATLYDSELLGKTYLFRPTANPSDIVCFLTVSSDGFKVGHSTNRIRRKINKNIPWIKQRKVYPAVKIGRLGVNLRYQGLGVGSRLMYFIKSWVIANMKIASRFLVVDAYNEPGVLSYYSKNGFEFLLPEEMEMKEDSVGYMTPPKTRLMFFDLKSK